MIPKGYKNTAVGIIPEDWEVKKLEEINLEIKSGANKKKSEEGKYKVYGSTGVIGLTNEYVFDEELLLCARVGANAGLLYKVSEKCDISDNTLIISKFKNIDIKYCEESLRQFNLNRLVFGSGQPLITGNLLKKLKLPLPPLPEQKAIAQVLQAADKEISLLNAKAEKLREQKKWLMQVLLTGRIRLNNK